MVGVVTLQRCFVVIILLYKYKHFFRLFNTIPILQGITFRALFSLKNYITLSVAHTKDSSDTELNYKSMRYDRIPLKYNYLAGYYDKTNEATPRNIKAIIPAMNNGNVRVASKVRLPFRCEMEQDTLFA